MRNSLALHRRFDSASANDNLCSIERSADITHRVHVFMTVLCILGILTVIVSWLFLMMAISETQPEPAIFLDR
jgi:hypothetical protein